MSMEAESMEIFLLIIVQSYYITDIVMKTGNN